MRVASRRFKAPLTNRQAPYRDIVKSMFSWHERSVVTLELDNRNPRTKDCTDLRKYRLVTPGRSDLRAFWEWSEEKWLEPRPE